ncbi:Wzz/FepE/Etk N-terminal domain-containing protein [Pseudarthrobacter sp902506025]|uniref:YveK family protein n=1 Tax=Pseudarthrobacter sp. 902506025 TaxID=3155291 RepID=UPI00344E8410
MKQPSNVPPATVRLRELAAQVSRRWLILLVTVALAIAGSVAASSLVKQEYTATASLTVSPLTTNPFSTAAVNQQININTERAILESNEVARMAAEELGTGPAPNALLKRVDVAAPSGSQVLEVSVTMPNPQEAADYANAMAGAYLRFRAKGASDLAAGYITALNEEIARLSAIPNPTEQQAQRLSEASQQRQNFALVADSPGRIIGVANPPSQPSSLSPLSFLVAGLIGGILLGIAAALMRERLDGRVRTLNRLAETSSAPALKVTDGDDAEGIRWVFRSLTPALDARESGPALVGLMSAFGKAPCPPKFTDGLAEVARAAGLSVLVVRPADIYPAKIDQGWPGSALQGWQHRDLVLFETDQQLTGARRAALADHLDAVVMLTYSGSKLKDLQQLDADLEGSTAIRVRVLLGNAFNGKQREERQAGSLLTLPTAPIADRDQDQTQRKERA